MSSGLLRHTIGGSIDSTQVAFGSSSIDAITGNAGFLYDSSNQVAALGPTATLDTGRILRLSASLTPAGNLSARYAGVESNITINPSVNQSNSPNPYGYRFIVQTAGSHTITGIQGIYGELYHGGTGTLDNAYAGGNFNVINKVGGTIGYANAVNAQIENDAGGTISTAVGHLSYMSNYGTGTLDKAYHFWAGRPANWSTGAFNLSIAFYAETQEGLGGTVGLGYAFWADDQGVYRIRSDNTFDSVYQAIQALYNPLFTKYTPGATNFERIVTQWETNVATITTEAGGTGTLRALNLGDASVQVRINGKNLTLSGNLVTTGAFNPTFAIPSSSTWTFPSGGGTLSTTTGTVTSIATTSPISGGTITGTGTLSLLVNVDYGFTAGQTITAPVGAVALTLAGGTQTTSQPVINATQTWNDISTAFTGIFFNATVTAAAAASLLIDLQAGGASKFSVTRGGVLTSAGRISALGGITFGAQTCQGQYYTDTSDAKGYWDTGLTGFNWMNENRVTTNVNLAVRAVAAQSADLTQWVAAGGTTVLASVDVTGIMKAAGYKSSDGSAGATGGPWTTVTVKNGLVVSGS